MRMAERMMLGRRPKIPPESMRYATVGIEFIGMFGLFLWAGIWLDGCWQTSPAMTLAGMVLGFGGGMYRFIRVSRQYQRSEASGKREPDHDDNDDKVNSE